MLSLAEYLVIKNVGGHKAVCFACSVQGKERESKQDDENLGNGKVSKALASDSLRLSRCSPASLRSCCSGPP